MASDNYWIFKPLVEVEMNFPFETSAIEQMSGLPLVLYSNFPSSNKFSMTRELSLSKDGKISGVPGRWEVVDGVLKLHENSSVTEFRTMETRNKCVYAVGRSLSEPGIVARPILTIKKPVMDFGVCISSNVHYEKDTVPRILRSLEGDGFDMNRVVVVVGNDKQNDHKVGVDPVMGVMTVRKRTDIFGLTSLSNIPDACARPYWLLLHDTCEVTNGFTGSISNIDVSLNPDMVMFRPLDEKVEFGLYSPEFATRVGVMPAGVKPFDYFNIVVSKANIVCVLESTVKKDPARDVYGKGIRRETLTFQPMKFKKYRAKNSDTRRP